MGNLNSLLAGCAGLVVAIAASIGAAQAEETLRVVDWGGNSQSADHDAWYAPYAQKTGVKVIEDSWNGEVGKIKSMVEAGNVTWDVINGDVSNAIAGCDEGFLDKIDVSKLGGESNFLPGTVYACGVPTHVFSVIFGYNEDKIPQAWGSNRPKTIADMFDTKKFPGKRSLRKDPKWLLEQALMADGVAVADVYKVLAASGGVDRAFAKLDTIRGDVIWWTSGGQAPQLLADGEVAMAEIYSNQLYIAKAKEHQNFVGIWDGQVFAPNSWIIPKGANLEAAMRFLEYVTKLDVAKQLYQTQSTLGLAIAGGGNFIPADRVAYVPTAPDNMKTALNSGEAYWADNYEAVNNRFQQWLSK